MKNYTSLLFDNEIYGTVLLAIDEKEKEMGCITTKSTCHPLILSRSSVLNYFEPSKRKQVKNFDSLLCNYTPMGRAFLGEYHFFGLTENGENLVITSIKDLEVGKEYYNGEFNYYMREGRCLYPLIYKGIFPGTLGDFYDMYKEVMFEEDLKVAKDWNKVFEKKIRQIFKSMLEKGLI